MSFETGDAVELYDAVSRELPVIGDFPGEYRSAAAAFVEHNFPGGPASVHDELPEDAEMLPRYITSREVSAEELESVSEDAAYLANFAHLRRKNLGHAVDELQGSDRHRVVRTGAGTLTGRDLVGSFQIQESKMERINEDIRAVAEFLEASDEIPVRPSYRIKQLYHTEDAEIAEIDDIDFPQENYWPFDNVSTTRN